jgi:uncharacterized membrane protein YesL
MSALRVAGRALRDAWDALVQLALLNLVWFGLSLTVVLMPPATVAMFEATNELARGRSPSLADFVAAVPRHFLPAWGWAILNVAVGIVLGVNLSFYSSPEPLHLALRGLFLLATLLWVVSQLLVWPYRFEQADPSLRLALRNALLTTLAAPVFSIIIGAVVALVVALSVIVLAPIPFFTAAFLGLLGNHVVLDRLVAFGKRPRPIEPEDER